MFRMHSALQSVVIALCLAAAAQGATTLAPEELKKQEDFKKAYENPGRLDRVDALKMLEGCTHPSTLQILSTVINTETFNEVKIAAFKLLVIMPATEPNLSALLANHFQALKPNDFDTRLAFAELMKRSEFKYEIFEALADYGSKMRYPDIVTWDNNRNGGGVYGGDPNIMIRKLRAEFEKYMKVFNAATQAGLPIQDKSAPATIRTWWQSNQAKVLAADKVLLENYRHADIEQRNKNGAFAAPPTAPLAGKSTPKKSASKDDE